MRAVRRVIGSWSWNGLTDAGEFCILLVSPFSPWDLINFTNGSSVLECEWIAYVRLNDKAAMEGMGLNPREVMDLAISTMSAMTFSWGFVHCDPHTGNILVRKHPTKKGKPQIVRTLKTGDFGLTSRF